MQVGDKVKCRLAFEDSKNEEHRSMLREGRIIYINPRHHYFTAEFDFGDGATIRESFEYIPEG